MDCLGNKAVHFYSVPCASGIYWFWDVESLERVPPMGSWLPTK